MATMTVCCFAVGSPGRPRLRALPFGHAPHDGILSLAETRLRGADRREAPCIHTFIMNDRMVTSWFVEFLRNRPAQADSRVARFGD